MSEPAPSGPGRSPAVMARRITGDEMWAVFVEQGREQARRALNNARTDEQLRYAAHASRGFEAMVAWFEAVAHSDETVEDAPTLDDYLRAGDFQAAADLMSEDL